MTAGLESPPLILIAACDAYPDPTPSVEALLRALQAQGVRADYRSWKRTPPEALAAADAVLPLCCWDYHDRPEQFLDWVSEIEVRGGRLLNTPATLRWNFRKTYLLDLAAQGLSVPRTIHLTRASRSSVEACLQREEWGTAVLKPVSGQSGYGVRKVDLADPASWPDDAFAGEALVQEFQDDIGRLGETTLTFIDGIFSHAIRRVLRPGEWRANLQYGTVPEPVEVAADVVSAAQRFLEAVPDAPLYARVDSLVRSNGFMLMELELIEPYLYLEFAPGSADRLAQALLRRLA